MNIVELHRRAVAEFDRRVRAVGDEQWHLPTPCSDWNVRELVNHLVNEDCWTPPLIRGQTIEEVGDRFGGDLLGGEPVRSWEEAARDALAAIQEPGAMERTVHLSFGDHPGSEYTWQLFVDHLVHAWDLARAIGADERLDPELVDVCYERSGPEEDVLKSFGVYGPKVEAAPDADIQTRLLAIFGRVA